MDKRLLFRRLLFSVILLLSVGIAVAGYFERGDVSIFLKALLPFSAGAVGLASTFYSSVEMCIRDSSFTTVFHTGFTGTAACF